MPIWSLAPSAGDLWPSTSPALALALVATNAAAVACSLFAGWMRHGVRLLDLHDAHDEREQEEGARRKQQ